MGVVKKQTVSLGWLNSAANANTLSAGDFYVVDRDGTYQATSGSTFVKVEQAELPDFGSAAFAAVGDFATAAQGALAESALQQVKTINGQSIVGTGNIVISSDAPLWVSGTTYAAGKYVVSPLSSHVYMRRTAGAGTTDPANDKTNWRLIGAGGLKSIQKGVAQLSSTATSLNITISAVVITACLVNIGQYTTTSNGSIVGTATGSLLNSTTLQLTRSAYTGLSYIPWEIIEYWS